MRRYLQAELIHDGHRYISDDTLVIEDDGTIVDTVGHEAVDEHNIEKHEGILCPGFVNAHCHTELSYMKGMIPEGEGLANFVQSVLKAKEGGSEIERNLAIAEAIEGMLDDGIVAVGDICNTLDSFPAKGESPIYFHNFFEVSGFDPVYADERLAAMKKLKENADKLELGNCKNSLSPHSIYSTSPELIESIIRETPELISIHNQESLDENYLTEKKEGQFLALYKNLNIDIDFYQPTGLSALQTLLPHIEGATQVLLVHDTFTSAADLEALKKARQENFSLILCPKSNLYIEDTLPDFYLLFQSETDNIALGTDSLASNDSLSILDEIKTLLDREARLDLEQCLALATSHGARALQIDDRYGSFVKGKKPGINQIVNESVLHKIV